jgi:hypothetical protein
MIGRLDRHDALADVRMLFAQVFGSSALADPGPMIRISPASLMAFITCAKNSLSNPACPLPMALALWWRCRVGWCGCRSTSSCPDRPRWKTLAWEWSIQTIA